MTAATRRLLLIALRLQLYSQAFRQTDADPEDGRWEMTLDEDEDEDEDSNEPVRYGTV